MIVGSYKVLRDKKPDGTMWFDCVNMVTGDVCQCYRIYKEELDSEDMREILLETVRSTHRSVSRLIDIQYYEKSGEVFLFFDQLLISFSEVQGLTNGEANMKIFFQQMCLGLRHLHNLGIAHRCMVLGNVWVTPEGWVKLRGYLGDTASRKRLVQEGYAPPELRDNTECDWFAVDVWCLGICLYVMLHGKAPWASGEEIGKLEFKDGLSKEVVELMEWMLKAEPKDRPSVDDVLKSSWIAAKDDDKAPEDRYDLDLEQLIDSFFDYH